MNVSEYVFEQLATRGITDVFTVTGGGIMHLTDALGSNPDITYWCNYHEQACAIAAESYARLSGRLGVCLVTAGPGATNALSGLVSAWMDSTPVLVLAGQVRRDLASDFSRWRQVGPQEVDSLRMATAVAKFAERVDDPSSISEVLERAIAAATSGRPGPAWVEIPLDIQASDLAADSPGHGQRAGTSVPPGLSERASTDMRRVREAIGQSSRPVIVAGKGIRIAGAQATFDDVARRLQIPVVTTIGGMDVLGEDHPLNFGRFGPTGQRRANFVVQNSDLLLAVGTGLSVAAIGFDTSGFAPHAAKMMVNIDEGELAKPNLSLDVAVHCDLAPFLAAMATGSRTRSALSPARSEWLEICREWKLRYPLLTADHTRDPHHVNSYYLAHALSRALGEDDVVLTGNSLDAHSVFHSFAVKSGQRVYTNTNYGAMGWDLPALVGACVAHRGERVILVTGDGSLQFNVQELLTIGRHHMNARIFVLNNGGYQAIRATQKAFCAGRLMGSDEESGVFNPSFDDLASAYGLRYARIIDNAAVDEELDGFLEADGPLLCEVNLAYQQERTPRVQSRRLEDGTMESGSLQDQYPFLPREEIEANMRISAQK